MFWIGFLSGILFTCLVVMGYVVYLFGRNERVNQTIIKKLYPMDIVDTRDTLLLWLDSCKTSEQVCLFGEIIEELIVKKV